ncbi:hypothetical protein ACVBEH_31470, partial [Roseateles sp. GG27B]
AHVRKTVTVEDVLKSAPLAWPIKLLDVPPISDGAAAVVLSSEALAAYSTTRPAIIRGIAYCADLPDRHADHQGKVGHIF